MNSEAPKTCQCQICQTEFVPTARQLWHLERGEKVLCPNQECKKKAQIAHQMANYHKNKDKINARKIESRAKIKQKLYKKHQCPSFAVPAGHFTTA